MIVLALARGALAYEFADHCGSGGSTWEAWPSAGFTASVSTVSFSETGQLHAALDQAIEAWDQSRIGGTNIRSARNDFDGTTTSEHDLVNLLYASYDLRLDPNIPDCSVYAATHLRGPKCPGAEIKEFDVRFNADCDWRVDPIYSDLEHLYTIEMDIEQSALHEIGHATGLDHEDGQFSSDLELFEHDGFGSFVTYGYNGWPRTMETSLSGSTAVADDDLYRRIFDVGEDDREGLRALYPDADPEQQRIDLSVQSFYVAEVDVALSRDLGLLDSDFNCHEALNGLGPARAAPHKSTFELAIEAGLAITDCPTGLVDPDPIEPLQVWAGLSAVDATFTLNNLGSVELKDVPWRIYVGDHINGAIQEEAMATVRPVLGPNIPFQTTETVIIPDTLAEGMYVLVAEIDPGRTLGDIDGSNNQAVWNREIEVIVERGCGCSRCQATPGSSDGSWIAACVTALAMARRRVGPHARLRHSSLHSGASE